MQRTALVLVLVVVSVVAFRAQQPIAPQFEVASVKPSNPNPSGPLGSIPMMLPPMGGRFTATNVPLRLLGPDLKASTADCANQADQAQKLAEAFAKGGAAAATALLPRNGQPIPCAVGPMMPTAGAGPMGFGLRGNGVPLSSLTRVLTEFTGRMVNDKTGLTGLYDWEMRFDPEVMMQMAVRSGVNLPPGITLPPSDSPSLLTALREQLGLKVDSERGPVEVVVIESAELPTPD